MAQSSIGFDGTVDTVQWATLSAFLGTDYCVATASALASTQSAGSRTVIVAAGIAFGRGVATTLSVAENIALPIPSQGQWYLIALRRVWATKATSLVAVPHSTTTTAPPTVPPSSYPAARLAAPGVQDEQPLAWVWVNSANVIMVIFDLRTLPNTGRVQRLETASRIWANAAAKSADLRTPLEGDQAWQSDNKTGYRYRDGAWVVVEEDTGWITPALGTNWTAVGGETPQYKRKNGVVMMQGRASRSSGSAPAFVLGAGFLPQIQHVFMSEMNGAPVRTSIPTDGAVPSTVPSGSIAAISFSSMPDFAALIP